MTLEREIGNKVVEFAQSPTTTKQFRHDYPVADELRFEMISELYYNLTNYVRDQYYEESYRAVRDYAIEHDLKADKRRAAQRNVFWWQLLYHANKDDGVNFVEDYIGEHRAALKKKPLLKSWLREWNKAVPTFYYVGQSWSDRAFVLVDILTEETLDIILFNPRTTPLKKGEVVTGTVIPVGDALYFPITDFYHFQIAATEEIAKHLPSVYEKHLKNSTPLEAFIHVFSVALQIEQLVAMENQEDIPTV